MRLVALMATETWHESLAVDYTAVDYLYPWQNNFPFSDNVPTVSQNPGPTQCVFYIVGRC